MSVMPGPRIALLAPLAASLGAFSCTLLVHALAINAMVNVVRRQTRARLVGASFWIDVAIVTAVVAIAFAAHLIEIALWAGLFLLCWEFSDFAAAFNHSAVNYTTLGYGDVVMSPSWRLLGPLEAATGILMFGVSTAAVFAAMHRLIVARLADLRD